MMSRNPPPRALWDAAVAGSQQGQDALLRQWLPVVIQWCRRLGGPAVEPEDAAHDVALVVLRRLHTVQVAEQFPSWLFSVTRRVLAQHRRKAWVRRWLPGASTEQQDPAAGPEDRSQRAQLAAELRTMLDQLAPELREVIVLVDVEERTNPEAAALIGIPTGTAASRLRRARRDLRALMEQAGLGPEPIELGGAP